MKPLSSTATQSPAILYSGRLRAIDILSAAPNPDADINAVRALSEKYSRLSGGISTAD